MPTRKQRRRRAKEQRHEYVWTDAEGNELPPEEAPVRRKQQARGEGGAPARRRGFREPQPPSWARSVKRGLIFAPIMLATVMLLSSELTFAQQVSQTLFIVAIFIPFSYFLDRLFWRAYLRRSGQREGAERARGS
ncbi:MAG TPA: hypothetical protein VNJ46_02295 [Gaiellaceae bacterium]|nr:hypothetical protein [Gaiellaceae bacterium]